MSNRFNLHIVRQKLAKTKRELPVLLAKQAENYFTDSFTRQGLGDKKWKEVQRRIPGTYAYKYPSKKGLQRRTSPILVGAGWKKRGGTLRRKVSRSLTNASWDLIRLAVDLPYAEAQNDGTDVIPARPFIKQTKQLEKMQLEKINTYIDKVWG